MSTNPPSAENRAKPRRKRPYLLAGLLMAVASAVKALGRDEIVILYPAYGVDRGEHWEVPVRVGVTEELGAARRAVSGVARKILARKSGLDALDEQQKALFAERARGFVADSESGERVTLQFDDDPSGRVWQLTGPTGFRDTGLNGYTESILTLPKTFVETLPLRGGNPWLTMTANSPEHAGGGQVQLVGGHGLSVISDIDDTLKITGLTEGEETILRRTFFEPFKAVPCMAAFYRSLPEETVFHYVSGSPWQLYPPIADFLFAEAGFPRGSVHMKTVRTHLFSPGTYRDLAGLILGDAKDVTFAQKLGQIRAIVSDFPQREFILVGDSGEMDPEIFAAVREAFPEQIREIVIRDVNQTAEREPERVAGMRVIPAGEEHAADLTAVCQGQQAKRQGEG